MTNVAADRPAIQTSDPLQRSQAWLSEVLVRAGWPVAITASPDPIAPQSYWLTLEAADLDPQVVELLLGDGGVALDALQYLANTLLNVHLPKPDQHGYTLELAGHRAQQREALQTIAQSAIDQVRTTGEPYAIAHLSAAERKQLHALICAQPGFATHSEGQDPDRRLIVSLAPASVQEPLP